MAELLTQTTLRIADKLKTAAEAAADRESSSFSNYVCRAVAEKLARDAVLLVGEEVHRFAVLVEFDLPESLSGTPLTDTVQVTTTKVATTVREVGANNVSATLMAVLPS